MGFFDSIFGGASREPEPLSPVERRLQDRLSVLADDPATANEPVRLFLRWTGQVQGVGFRFNNTNIAKARSLTGWVRNMADGSVEMEVQGPASGILDHLRALHESYANMGARFKLAEERTRAIVPDEASFEPRYEY